MLKASVHIHGTVAIPSVLGSATVIYITNFHTELSNSEVTQTNKHTAIALPPFTHMNAFLFLTIRKLHQKF